MRRPLALAVAAFTAVTLLSACGSSDGDSAASVGSDGSALKGEITVFAAASLTGSFTELGQRFETAHPGTKINFSFGPSSGLATQIIAGSPADVFAAASAKNMDAVVAAKAADTPATFAKNVMEIAVPPANPASVSALADLAKPGVKVALCAAEVPCGVGARAVFSNAKLTVRPVTEEVDVKATLTKVQLGEVDAGVVYLTDVLAAGDKVTGIKIPADVNASTSYPISTLTGSSNAALAKAYVDYVRSRVGVQTLTAAGFQKP
ncbi:MAG TPA: molybdate ABC transporter substrate-binding protein [Kineosporiaceae bacterium]|nr:molybdate ABC transporter substrate-binding protein [Kineosporiaceae bacterium]